VTKWPARRVRVEMAPERLHRYVPSEWAGDVEAYTREAFAWARQDPDRRMEYGDAIDILQWHYRYVMAKWRDGEGPGNP
jgi:hypothetical protein